MFVTGKYQCRAYDRFAEFFEERPADFIIRDSETNGFAFRIDQSARDFAGRRKNKGKSSRCCRLDLPVGGVVDLRIDTQVRQVTTNQCEVMVTFQAANLADPFDRFFVTDMTAERIRRVGWVGNDSSFPEYLDSPMNKPGLRVYRVYTEELAHGARILAWYHEAMRQFIEFIPVAAFVAVFFSTDDIYLATGVLMLGVCVQVGYEYGTTKSVGKQTQVIFWVVMIFGAATLVFQNDVFIKWKPTIVNWLFCLALLGSQFLMAENLLKKMLGKALELPELVWRNLAFGWSLGFFVAGALNIFVAYMFSTEFWVTYKLVGGISITLIYMIITVTYLYRGGYLNEIEEEPTSPAE